MIQISDTLVSFDLIERHFLCEPAQCKGVCCIEGDSGAPLEADEVPLLQNLLPVIWNDLFPAAQEVIKRQGVSYVDVEGDRVTSIVDGRNCVFTCRDEAGICRCAVEKAFNGQRTDFRKPLSCHLYPVRIKRYAGFTAVNLDRWDICRSALTAGERAALPAYRFLREPLIRRFGQAWYDELALFASAWRPHKSTPQ